MKELMSIFFSSVLLCSHSYASETVYPLQQVVDGIYFHQGAHEDATQENIGAIANVGFVIGETCVAVIDSGGSFLEGQKLRESIKATTTVPICYVINTHVHPDHILGNAAFKEDEPIYIGHEKLPDAMLTRASFFERAFSETLGEAFKGVEFIPPTQLVSVDSPLELDLGGRILSLTAYHTAHTDHDVMVYDTSSKTVWTGDLLFADRIPVIDGSINGWISLIEEVQELDVNVWIPGHGKVLKANGVDAWQKQLHYLSTMRTQIREIIYNFGTIDEATQSVGTEHHDHWLLFDDYHRRNVTAAFVELEWE
jgi:quinoprotein relay system zinc metallohydrolase 2